MTMRYILATLPFLALAQLPNFEENHIPYHRERRCHQRERCDHQKGEYWDSDACECFKTAQCYKMCPPGEKLDPREFCKCVPEKVVDDLHSNWAQIDSTRRAQCRKMCPPGQKLDPREFCKCIHDRFDDDNHSNWAQTDSNRSPMKQSDKWKVCPFEENVLKCEPGMYWNELACTCFTPIMCLLMCPLGQEIDPRHGCKCVDAEKLRSELYPSWATDDDIEIAMVTAFQRWEQLKKISVCPAEENHQKCGQRKYWNELACQCFSFAHCRKGCPPGQHLSPLEMCKCLDDGQIAAMYPDWATASDKKLADLVSRAKDRAESAGEKRCLPGEKCAQGATFTLN